jgi:uncharacterized phage infection (PIP) family protein YhgE
MQLSNSQRFLTEYQDFKDKISKIPNLNKRQELTDLLNQLVNEVRSLDNKHAELNQMSRMPSSVTDIRESLSSIRKTLHSRLTDYGRNQSN